MYCCKGWGPGNHVSEQIYMRRTFRLELSDEGKTTLESSIRFASANVGLAWPESMSSMVVYSCYAASRSVSPNLNGLMPVYVASLVVKYQAKLMLVLTSEVSATIVRCGSFRLSFTLSYAACTVEVQLAYLVFANWLQIGANYCSF